MQISKQLKKGQNKKDIEKFEKQLEDLKSSTDDGDIIKGKILELENLIKKYYNSLPKFPGPSQCHLILI
jgi:hypothetical protein